MKNTQVLKSAWIDEAKRLVSFVSIQDAEIYTAPEEEFWAQILIWMRQNYRIG